VRKNSTRLRVNRLNCGRGTGQTIIRIAPPEEDMTIFAILMVVQMGTLPANQAPPTAAERKAWLDGPLTGACSRRRAVAS